MLSGLQAGCNKCTILNNSGHHTGKQQSFQEALDLYDREGEDFWYWYSAKDRYDYAFDVREVDGMVALVVCHTSGFDDDGYPMRMTNPHDRESFECSSVC